MKRLRHPIRAIREPFGTAGLIVACIALVAALGGTALAAKGALTGKQKKEVEKIAKKFAGKNGAPGTNGTNGTPGINGINGANGKDGAPGPKGDPGDPWTLGGTLPEGATETGAWAVQANEGGGAVASLTFGIPLKGALGEAKIKLVEAGETGGSGCTGGTASNPKADSGFLCVYIGNLQGATVQIAEIFNPTTGPLFGSGPESAAKSGAGLFLGLENGGNALVSGTYAVTG